MFFGVVSIGVSLWLVNQAKRLNSYKTVGAAVPNDLEAVGGECGEAQRGEEYEDEFELGGYGN